MQTTTAAFTAEEKDTVRKVVANLQVSWKRHSLLGNRTFAIGVSLIGGNDVIGINPGSVGSPGVYKYFDESAYIMSLAYERGLNMPTGGLVKAMGEAELDNNSGRFLPRYMGGNSELFTAILPQRPVKVSAGFNTLGIDYMLSQFAGVLTEAPKVDVRSKTMSLRYADYINYFQNKYLDRVTMFTAQQSDVVLESLFSQLGMATSQYRLDAGINIIPFGFFDVGTKFADAIHQIVEAENGHFYQDEEGVFRFENRQHWDSSPYNTVQRIITTSQVINAEAPNDDHLVNVVEVKSSVRAKQPTQLVFSLSTPYLLAASGNTDVFVNFDDPILEIIQPVNIFTANTKDDDTGQDLSTSISVIKVTKFAQSAKITFSNSSTSAAYLTALSLYGRPARVSSEIYYRDKRGISVTAYDEHLLTLENNFIQSPDWAQSYAQMILDDYSRVENLQRLTIKAQPDIQLGDLISWQGRYWRIFDIKTTIDPGVGFVQELLLLQRTIVSYFRIGVSTIGGTDKIAP